MRLWQRAYLYVRRRKSKSLFYFLIIFLLSSFSVIGILLRGMADLAVRQTRESLNGAFRIAPDMQNRENVVVSESDGETVIRYIGEPLNEKIAEAVQSTRKITDYNAVIRKNVLIQEEISLIDYNGKYLDDDVAMHLISIEADTDSTYASDFQKERLRLTEGVPITADDRYAAVISEKLALQNHLEIGDEIRLSPCRDQGGQEIRVAIRGLFQVKGKQLDTDVTAPVHLLENRIFIDLASAVLLTDASGADYMEFFMDDPAEVAETIEEIQKIEGISWKNFVFIPEIGEYEKAAGPLASTRVLLDTLLKITATMSLAVLSLIQMFFRKAREHETGILLSLGISRKEIILQHFTEMAMVAFAAFFLSFALCFPSWKGIGKLLYPMAAFPADMEPGLALFLKTAVAALECGTAMLFLTVLLSDIWLMRLNPKKLFSKLS